MAIAKYIKGTVVERSTATAQAGLIVRLSLRSGRGTSPIAETLTDTQGRFSFEAASVETQSSPGSGLRIGVFSGARALSATGDVAISSLADADNLVIAVTYPTPVCQVSDAPPDDLGEDFSSQAIYGAVRHVDGTGREGLILELYRYDYTEFRDSVVPAAIDTSVTLRDGWFSFDQPSELPVDLYIKVCVPSEDPELDPRLVGTSRLNYQYNGGPLRVDISVTDQECQGTTEFQRISEDLSRALFPGSVSHPASELAAELVALNVQNVAWLEGRTGWSMERITSRVCAERLSLSMSETSSAMGAEYLYGALCQGLPETEDGILSVSPSKLKSALLESRSGNIVQADLSTDEALAWFQEARLRKLKGGGETSLGSVLRATAGLNLVTGLTESQVESFCRLNADFSGTDQEFWAAAGALSAFPGGDSDPALGEARRLVRVGTVALGHAPTAIAVLSVLGTQEAEEVVTFDDSQWIAIAQAVSPLPAGLPGDDVAEQRANLALLLKEHAELAFPAKALETGLTRNGSPFELSGFFQQNPNLDLRTVKLGVGSEPKARLAQRLCRIAPSTGTVAGMERMLSLGFLSARDVTRTGKARFLETYSSVDDEGSPEQGEALDVFRKAQSQAGMAAAFFLQAHPALGQAPVSFNRRSGLAVTDEQIPCFSSLFGSSTQIEESQYLRPPGTRGDWCSSIHGPSAYLVDLLDWIGDKAIPWSLKNPKSSAFLVLNQRRPDIARLPLSCENATRSLPYIDLVLEVLEDIVAGGEISLTLPHSSDVESTEMLSTPQYINESAYGLDKAGDSSRSFRTPFHRPLHEARAFLRHLGVERTDLMRWRCDCLVEGLEGPSEEQVAFEELGLSVESAGAITGTLAESTYWSLLSLDSIPTVRQLKCAAEMSYTEILDLLHTQAATSAGFMDVVIPEDADPYDESSYLIISRSNDGCPTVYQFGAMRRMIRLWKATGWTLLETDKVLRALQGEQNVVPWNDQTLTFTGDLHRLARLTGLEPVPLAAWFADMDTRLDRVTADNPKPSLFDSTFLSRTLFPACDIDSEEQRFPFALSGSREELHEDCLELLIEGQIERLHSVLGVDEAEVRSLLECLFPDTHETETLSLSALSSLYRWTSLASALELAPSEAFRLARCMGRETLEVSPTAYVFGSPSNAIEFIELAKELDSAGWKVEDIEYLLLHESEERVAPTDDMLRGILGRMRDLVSAQGAEESEETRILKILDTLASELGVSTDLVDYLDVGMLFASMKPPQSAVYPCFLATEEIFSLSGAAVAQSGPTWIRLAGQATVLIGGNQETVAVDTVILVPEGSTITLTSPSATLVRGTPCRFSAEDVIHIPWSLAVSVAAGTVISYPGTNAATLVYAVVGVCESATLVEVGPLPLSLLSSSERVCKRFLAEPYTLPASGATGDPWADITRETWSQEFAVLEAMLKATTTLARIGVLDEERAALSDPGTNWEVLEPSLVMSAPLENRAISRTEAFRRFKNSVDLFALRGRMPGTEPDFSEILLAPNSLKLAERTGWDYDTLFELGSDQIESVQDLKSVIDGVGFVKRTGASVQALVGWAAPGSLTLFTTDMSQGVVAAARSRYPSATAWASVARPIRDVVRKAQRDVLVSYLIAMSGESIQSADELYEQYLIDVSMNPEMLTSRVVQAACSVQLFVHRCLFGLESSAVCACFNDEDRAEWEWMRTYRVWEVARKVFLYPENWIEPELRDDKSSFYRALERELAQGEVNEERVEQVTLDYLDRLSVVSNLKVLAYYVEKETDADGSIDRLHVFARTRNDPPSYWYRRRDDGTSWTGWEKVETAVTGEHLIPVVFNRRLVLCWAEFTEVQSDDCQNEAPVPMNWWEIRLAMSEYRNGKWSPKVLSASALSTKEKAVIFSSKENFCLVSSQDAESVTIDFLARNLNTRSRKYYFMELGSMTFGLEAQSIQVSQNQDILRIDRLGLGSNKWYVPGFWTGSASLSNDVSVYQGETDEEGFATSTATLVELLGSCPDATVVLPGQWVDFLSQSPFFVGLENRSWFVEPLNQAEALFSSTLTGNFPSVGGLSAHREGTSSSDFNPLGRDEYLREEDAEQLSYLHRAESDISRAAARSRTQDCAVALGGGGMSSDVIHRLGEYRFLDFHHPFVADFQKEVRRHGIFGLIDPEPDGTAGELFRQVKKGSQTEFQDTYAPSDRVERDYPRDEIDFSYAGAYSAYNWELFFHIPFYIANRLADEGRYQESINYFHAMFDPRTRTDLEQSGITGAVGADSWWKLKPFLEPASQPVTDWVAFTATGGDSSALESAQQSFENQVAQWREDPFNPHLLARLRPGTYQRALVMRYLDTLVAWGDHLFSKDTLESLNEATQLYVFARQVLGDRQAFFEKAAPPEVLNYNQLALEGVDEFGNALVAIENACFNPRGRGGFGREGVVALRGLQYSSYFGVPFNPTLLSYWDTIEDRLFKIRNGMNIEGVVRSLPLFQPPLDPAMFVRAAAAGVDIGSVLDGLESAAGPYRFSVMLGRAQGLAGSVRALGQALLSALEKRDAESLALLRQGQESAVLDAVRDVRRAQVEEATENFRAARRSRELVKVRRDYYGRLLEKGLIKQEESAGVWVQIANTAADSGAAIAALGEIGAAWPNLSVGIAAASTSGGSQAAHVTQALISGATFAERLASGRANALNTKASHKRRAQEWRQQKNLAVKELEQIEKQIEAARIRRDIALKEQSNHELQISHSAEVRDWLEQKYTRQELYDWTASQLCALHFQAWRLAYATAKKAESCYQHEIGTVDTFIQNLHWDSTRKGLLAGEKLAADLERMDMAYLENDTREHEMTKHVSLQQLDPMALEMLKKDGECYFEIPEALFDIDCRGHYRRRIQSLGVSLPCVSGPFGTVNAMLTLCGSFIRRTPDGDLQDEDFSETSIVTSVATQDSGLFQLDHKDPRYLPFEKMGAVSRWHFRLTAQGLKQFDWTTIEDLIIHLRYTAKYDGSITPSSISSIPIGVDESFGVEPSSVASGLARAISVKSIAPDAFAAAEEETGMEVEITEGMIQPITVELLASGGGRTLQQIIVIPVLPAGSTSDYPTTCGVSSATGDGSFLFGTVKYFKFTGNLPTIPGDLTVSFGCALGVLDDIIIVMVFN